jgi:hypothetical protein
MSEKTLDRGDLRVVTDNRHADGRAGSGQDRLDGPSHRPCRIVNSDDEVDERFWHI